MRKILAICDTEIEYATRLMHYIEKAEPQKYQVAIFSSADQLLKNMEQHPISVLVIHKDQYFPSMHEKKPEVLLLLSEEEEGQGGIQKGEAVIFKYSPASEILQAIRKLSGTNVQTKELERRNSPLMTIGIYSPSQEPSTTAFSIILGRKLSEESSVLYLNLHPYAGLKELFEEDKSQKENRGKRDDRKEQGISTGESLGDLLFFLRNQAGRSPHLLEEMVKNQGGLDYLPPASSSTDLAMVRKEDWTELIHMIEQTGRWKILLIEFGEGIQDLEELLQDMEFLCFPTRESPVAGARSREFRQTGGFSNAQTVSLPSPCEEIPEDPLEKLVQGPLTRCAERWLRDFHRKKNEVYR